MNISCKGADITREGFKHPDQVDYVVREILATCKDAQSRGFYTRIARVLPDERIFRFLAEIRQDPSIRNRGAVFTAKVKRYFREHGRSKSEEKK
jgi:hypothetical protein